ncbi:P-loop containing nucleoside triphosphate hydrolase protein [Truncatella angustata]|uniref:Kinesin-like protein n=1 Tax=Truncatella angustata TaxID=152316 RepID=A0A9P8UE76_9PEZI|nr:P-loop containing nucleoside triphosphate hydrolase protein [Truncatella angustata]KAH6648273.1 P-loop containing nucleoside triphosphate hydrolase protein [Truncatella angustata]
MDPPPPKSQASLFQVYLRLRPATTGLANSANTERCLLVEEPQNSDTLTHITLNPPNDRRRAIEKFAFTQVFEEDATQLDLFQGTGVLPLVQGTLAPYGGDGTDGLLATLGVTGSGKTHTMLGSKTQRGLTQLSLDVIFRSIEPNIVDSIKQPTLEATISASDASEASIYSAPAFLETVYSDFAGPSRAGSRAGTPMVVRETPKKDFIRPSLRAAFPELPGMFPESPGSVRLVRQEDEMSNITQLSTPPSEMDKSKLLASRTNTNSNKSKLALGSPSKNHHYMSLTSAAMSKNVTKSNKSPVKGDYALPPPTPKVRMTRPSAMPHNPDINSIRASCDPSAEYAILISMYEVYNDRIFDLLTPPIRSNATKEYRRRPLLFKPTEQSPDRKVVAGLRKVICGNLKEALLVLEAGLHERRVAGTGSNSVSSRSHGFFCVEIKKRRKGRTNGAWGGSTLSIVDLAGSERARDAKTHGATLAEAGKINESLMYLGQCLQMQSDMGNTSKPNLVPFRQCKLTELLFSNSFPSASLAQSQPVHRKPPQKAVMIVTADPLGDYNATSQILRYSALAREVTVPRVPSITQTILNNQQPSYPDLPQSRYSPSSSPPLSSPISPTSHHHKPFFHPSSPTKNGSRIFSPASDTERSTMENAALEIARMAEVIDQLNDELARESEARMTAEAHLMSMEDRLVDLEQDIREECYADFEQRLALEMARIKVNMGLEQERSEEHWDKKVEVLARGVGVTLTAPSDGAESEDEDKENVLIENLEQENERLRRELAVLKRELGSRTPSRRTPLGERGDFVGVKNEMAGLGNKMEELRVGDVNEQSKGSGRKTQPGSTGSPTKKVRKLTAKKWENIDADDDLF